MLLLFTIDYKRQNFKISIKTNRNSKQIHKKSIEEAYPNMHNTYLWMVGK